MVSECYVCDKGSFSGAGKVTENRRKPRDYEKGRLKESAIRLLGYEDDSKGVGVSDWKNSVERDSQEEVGRYALNGYDDDKGKSDSWKKQYEQEEQRDRYPFIRF